MATVMIVDPELLKFAPEAFQQYVADYFKASKCLGKPVLVAMRTLEGGLPGSGVAPRHDIHLQKYTDGLRHKQRLGDWIRDYGEGKVCWEFAGGFDSENVTHV